MSNKPTRTTANTSGVEEFDPFRDWFRSPFPGRLTRLLREPLSKGESPALWSPAVDLVESKEGYAISVELPGAKKEDVSVECHDNLLSIHGEKKSEREEKDEHRHYVERSYGSFSRSFRLPSDASADRVKATFKDGVLTIEIPKAEERKPKTVAIGS
jgi:HSP20 family protein